MVILAVTWLTKAFVKEHDKENESGTKCSLLGLWMMFNVELIDDMVIDVL